MKKCPKCNIEKSLESFHLDKTRKSGLACYCKDCVKLYSIANGDKKSQTAIKWRNQNRERFNKTQFEYAQKNKDKLNENKRAARRRRKARLKNNLFEKYSESQVLNLYGNFCHLCNKKINLNAPRKTGQIGWELSLHIDHVIPISKGGPDILDNVRPSHGICNVRKNDKL